MGPRRGENSLAGGQFQRLMGLITCALCSCMMLYAYMLDTCLLVVLNGNALVWDDGGDKNQTFSGFHPCDDHSYATSLHCHLIPAAQQW